MIILPFRTSAAATPADRKRAVRRTWKAAAVILLAGFVACATFPYGPRPHGRPVPAHHARRGFINPDHVGKRGLGEVLRWRLGLLPDEPLPIPAAESAIYKPAVVAPDLALLRGPDPAKIQITWIGQSTFLIQVEGLNILTDPLFSKRASPVGFAGPRRLAPPGVPFADLPRIDIVLVSHDHFDHLDRAAVRALGNGPRYFVPLGLGRWLAAAGIHRFSELDWGQTSSVGPLTIHAVPAQHFSGRTLGGFNRRLWAGWVVETTRGRLYFAGDTGYGGHFREIAARFSPLRIAFLPIGSYRPRRIMETVHMDPPEAVRAFRELGAEVGVAMHWGTLGLTDEPPAEPPLYLKKALRESGLDPDAIRVLKFGQTISLE